MSDENAFKSMLSRLTWDTTTYGLALFLERLTGFIILPLLTAGLDQVSFGAWSQILTAFALMSNILLCGFYHSILLYVPGADLERVARVFYGMFLVIVMNIVVFFLIALAIPRTLSNLLFATDAFSPIIFVAALFIASECAFEFVILAILRAQGHVQLSAVYYLGKNLVRLAVIWQAMTSGGDLYALLFRLSITNLLLILVGFAFSVAPFMPIAFRGLGRSFWRRAMIDSGAIVLSCNLAWANVSFNRFLIAHILGLTSLSIYSANYSLAAIVSFVGLIFNFVVPPFFNAAWNRGDVKGASEVLVLATEVYFFACLPAGLVIATLYKPLLVGLTSAQYVAPLMLPLGLILFIILFGFEQLLTFSTFANNAKFSVKVRTVALAMNLLLNLVLLRHWGLSVAAVGSLCSTTFIIISSSLYLSRVAGYRFPARQFGELGLCAVAMSGILLALTAWVEPAGILQNMALAVLGGVVYLAFEALRSRSLVRVALRTIVTPLFGRLSRRGT